MDYEIAVFIAGFATQALDFSLSINQPWYDYKAKELGVIFNCDSIPYFLIVEFAYIIYPKTHPYLKMVYDNIPAGDTGSYQVSGPVDIQKNNQLVYNEWRVENRNIPCTGQQCNGKSCILLEECNTQGGNFWQGQCFFCPDGIVFELGRCTRKCGANQIYFNRVCFCQDSYVREGVDCIKDRSCGQNQVWSEDENKCICDEISVPWNGGCRQCPANAFPNAYLTGCDCVNVGE